MRVLHKHFRSHKSWEKLFQDASDFASKVGPERLISISHSAHSTDGVVTVWYWGKPEKCNKCGYNLTGNESAHCPECGTQQSWTQT